MVDLTPEIKGMAKPQLLVDSQGNLHAVFESGVGGSYGQLTETEPTAVMVVSSFDRGATWSEPLRLSGAVESARNITIGEDGGGRLLLAWQAMDDSKVYFQLSDNHGQSWLPPQAFDDFIGGWSAYNSRVDSYSMATDSRGGLHLVLVGRTNPETANLSVLHVTWNGARWLPVDTIAAYSGDAPEWPRIAISNGNELNVVWTLRDKAHIWDSDGGRYKVYYARTLADAPWVAPVAYDPRPSQPTADVLTRPRETPVAPAAVPTPLAGTATAARSAYSETEVALIVLGSILPALVVVALVFGVARYRRAH
jgi:hypothetical protein